MISRKDFTYPEWQTLQTAIIGTAEYISLTDPGAIDRWREKIASKKLFNEHEHAGFYKFIREVVDLDHYKSPIPRHAQKSSNTISVPLFQAIKDATQLLKERDPAALQEFKLVIMQTAYEVAQRASGISAHEQQAIDKIRSALNGS